MGKDHIRLQFRNMFACQSRDLLRTGENGEAFHQQRVANAVVIIDGDGDDGARLKAPGGAADAHPPLLAQAIKGAIEAADLPAAKGQLGKPGDGGVDDSCSNPRSLLKGVGNSPGHGASA